jgi:hypothetical protein
MLNTKKNKSIMIIIIFIILISLRIYIFQDNSQPTPIITQELSFKISDDQKNIYYKETKSGEWKSLLEISDVNRRDILSIPFLEDAEKFTWLMRTPDKEKILIGVCDNLISTDDHAIHWAFIYNLRDRTQTSLPGRSNIDFSPNHKFIFTSDYRESGTTGHYIVSLETGKRILSLEIESAYAGDGDEINKELTKLLNAHGIIIKPQSEVSPHWNNSYQVIHGKNELNPYYYP